MLEGKNIVLGVCGSIAAYKSATLVRLLVKAGARVQVVMTPDATNFITPLTLSTLSKRPVLYDYFKTETGEWNNHVELGLWADVMVIAPASANTIAKMANGLVDNLLTAVYLSAKCPVYFAPAMDLDMWRHEATQKNVSTLQSFGNLLIAPANGELASGLHGEGRMAEPEEIISYLLADLKKKLPLANTKALVTAGPTYEAIDPVRFIGNHSSGKMGFAIADELALLGAEVTLISGPSSQTSRQRSVNRIDVTSAAEMLKACERYFKTSDVCVMSSAVADYTPVTVAKQKIKKQSDSFTIEVKKTTDILKTMGAQKRDGQLLVGFALETNNEEQNAIDKLQKKNLDFIVLNSLNDAGAGFKTDTNKITIIDRDLQQTTYSLKSKSDADAEDILQDVWYQFSAVINAEPIEQTGAWLYKVARNKITDKHKKKSEALLDDFLTAEEDGDAPDFRDILLTDDNTPETAYLRNLFWEQLFMALDELPDEQKQVFIWHELDDIPFAEIAERTGLNTNTLVLRKRYAVLHLRQRLKQLYEEITKY